MRRIILSIAVAVSICVMPGCTTSAARATYQAAATTEVTAETAVRAFNVFAAQGKTTLAQNLKVRAAYERYQACMAVLCDAGAVYAATVNNTNAPAAAGLAQAAQNVTTSISDVIAAVRSCGVQL